MDSWTFLGVTADLTTFIWFPPLSTDFTSFTSLILSEIITCRTVSCFQRIWRSWSSLTNPWSSWSLARSSQRIQKRSFGEPLVQSSIPGWISVQRPTGTWLSKDSNMLKLQERTKPYTPLKDTCVKLEESWIIWFPLTHAKFSLGLVMNLAKVCQGSLCIGRVSLLNVRVST